MPCRAVPCFISITLTNLTVSCFYNCTALRTTIKRIFRHWSRQHLWSSFRFFPFDFFFPPAHDQPKKVTYPIMHTIPSLFFPYFRQCFIIMMTLLLLLLCIPCAVLESRVEQFLLLSKEGDGVGGLFNGISTHLEHMLNSNRRSNPALFPPFFVFFFFFLLLCRLDH